MKELFINTKKAILDYVFNDNVDTEEEKKAKEKNIDNHFKQLKEQGLKEKYNLFSDNNMTYILNENLIIIKLVGTEYFLVQSKKINKWNIETVEKKELINYIKKEFNINIENQIYISK